MDYEYFYSISLAFGIQLLFSISYNLIQMYIQSLELNGWKTYSKPVTITGFDHSFNAISGHNGSGKSNILDAVQFVLGSNNRELLRLKSSLVELIYKEGQGKIQEASVTLRLRIPNKRLRPMGYEDNETLSVTRIVHKTKPGKFFIEGKITTAGRVKRMFQCMHLNIDNPHFIVKQGQITKLASSKPAGVLAMMEEAIGTANYVNSRDETLDTLKKTDLKMKQMNFVINNSITPFMEQIKSERALLSIYNLKQKELEELRERVFPYEYLRKTAQINKCTRDLENNKRTIQLNQQQIEQLKRTMEEQEVQKASYSQSAEEARVLRGKLNEAQLQVKLKVREFELVHERLQKLKKEYLGAEGQIDQLRHKQEKTKRRYLQFEDMQGKVVDSIRDKKRKLEELSNTSKTDISSFIQKEIKEFEGQISTLKLQIQSLAAKEQHIKNEIKASKTNHTRTSTQAQKRDQLILKLGKQIKELKQQKPPAEIQNPDAPEYNKKRNDIMSQLDGLANATPALRLRYRDPPVPNFNRSDVLGRLFDCFRIKNQQHYKALDIGAGGKLFNIVVKNQKTSSILLNHNCFGSYASIIPNNKITHRELPQDCLKALKRVAQQQKGFASVAYDLISYDKQLQPTIKFVFGTFAVVSSKQIGKAIAYNPNRNLRLKCVTFEGEVFDPNGTLSGGYYNFNNFILFKVLKYKKLEDQLNLIDQKKGNTRKEYEEYRRKKEEYDRVKCLLSEKTLELQRLEQLGRMVKNQQMSMEDMAEELKSIQQSRANLNSEVELIAQSIEKRRGMRNDKNAFDQQRRAIKEEISRNQAELATIKKEGATAFRELQDAGFNLKACQRVLQSYREIQKHQQEMQKIEQEIQILNKNQNQRKWQLEERVSGDEEEKINQLIQQCKANQERVQLLKSQTNKLTHSIHENQKELADHEGQRSGILKANAWVENFVIEKGITLEHYPPNYDYEGERKKYVTASGSLQSMENKISSTANMDTSKIQNQYDELMKKLEILERDKENLLKYIKDLDERRVTAIQRAYETIKANLKKIFKNLYPVAECDIVPADRNDLLKGFEITFSLGNIQKCLIELSGGQKSLLSLSFILALLLYRPCPFYFLDEIDAALDQVHTENLGTMIREHFPQSQFIIISLKQTMFRNANVLFNIQFVDNTSTVERITKNQMEKWSLKKLMGTKASPFQHLIQDENAGNNEEEEDYGVKVPGMRKDKRQKSQQVKHLR